MKEPMRLDRLLLGQYAKIVEIKADEDIKRRLMDLGMVRGTKIRPVLISPAGDPVAYEVRGAVVALRNRISSLVIVEEEGTA